MADKKHRLYTLYKSTNPKKKYDIYVINPKTDRIKKVSFGGKGYQNYTNHKDKDRRDRFRARHKNDNYDDITKPSAFSWHVLWGKSTNKYENLRSMLKKFSSQIPAEYRK